MTSDEVYEDYVSSMTESQLKEYIHTVGKAANQRLRELEKQGLQNSSAAYRYMKRISRDGDYATSKTGKGQMKFNLRVRGRSFAELRHMVQTIDDFMEAKSSTTAGVRDIYNTAAKTFSEGKGDSGVIYGTKEDYANFTEALSYSKLFRAFLNMYGSDIAIEVSKKISALGLENADLVKALEEAGFKEKYGDGETPPDYSDIERAINEYAEHKKKIESDSGGLFANNPLE